ncbi:hypothetical protein [Nitrosopumilus sp.]|uniref:hypothetical protein n=1 Tax=Nitrosopumilus sp. TaxID=2024843 RepID=UPI0034A02D5E
MRVQVKFSFLNDVCPFHQLLVGVSLWALYLTDIPQEQFQEDPRFEEEYTKYHQWNVLFGTILVAIGWVIAFLGRKMRRSQGSKLD